jgi:hypothetical protein
MDTLNLVVATETWREMSGRDSGESESQTHVKKKTDLKY